MDELRRTAKAYYESGTNEERRLFNDFFESMNPDARGQVRRSQFFEFMRREGHQNMCNGYFFNELDQDGSQGLDFYEVMTLYYIIRSGRPFCGQCARFVKGLYFTCMTCFNHATKPFCICLDCFRDQKCFAHRHEQDKFLDNFALLEEMRKLSVFARDSRENNRNHRELPSSSSRSTYQTNYNFTYSPSYGGDEPDTAASSLLALVPANIREHWTTAHRVFEAALYFKKLASVCTMM